MKPLVSIMTILFLLTAASCTAPLKRAAPPTVTGDIVLDYRGAIGGEDEFRSPWGISFGVDGTLYVCDRDKSAIVRIDTTGAVLSRYSNFTNRTERLYAPLDVSSTAGIDIFAIDSSDSRVVRLDRGLRNGFTLFDGGDSGEFGSFSGIVHDNVSGDLYVTDRDTGGILRIDRLNKSVRISSEFGSARSALLSPVGIDITDEGALFVADRGRGAIAHIEQFSGGFTTLADSLLEAPLDVAVLPEDYLAVADVHGVLVIDSDGRAHAFAGYDAVDMNPRSVAYYRGALYISDGITSSILVYSIGPVGRSW